MEVDQDKLLEALDEFEADLEVETILKKVKEELALDDTVTEFGEQLKERERQKGVAQATRAARATYFHPLCYPQHTCEWFVEGLDYCCSYWRYQFKRPDTPPPVPPPSPDVCRKRIASPQSPLQGPRKRCRAQTDNPPSNPKSPASGGN